MDGKNWSGAPAIVSGWHQQMWYQCTRWVTLECWLGCIHSISRSRSLATILFERVQIWFYFSLFIEYSFNLAFDRILESFVWTTGLNKLRFWACICSSHGSIWCWTKFPVLCRSCFTSTFTALWLQKELVLQVGSLAWTLLSENKKNIHELFEASFEESSLADYTPGWRLLRCSGLEFILFLDLASHLVGPSWKRQALYIYPQCLHTSFQRSSSSDKIEQLFTLCARS